ncbi:MAG: protein translocase subunit SecF [Alphaproteobacteria bacterium]|nr:protein translocase subunit SecF [Alphaproteobacteria bacterium]MCY4318745.1 protein translocase subunit SecF [Alphaproteobacteria bacterium]
MRPLRLIPPDTSFRFIALRKRAYIVSILMILASAASLATQGLNFGIDFVGGTLIEVRTDGPADIQAMRQILSALDRGEVGLQEFGQPTDVLIRIQQQPGGDAAQQATVAAVKSALGDSVEEYRRVEVVGPKVGGELIEAGAISVGLALLAIMAYIWFRFEWQFGVGAVLALAHDVVTTVGVFALLQLEFNLSTVAAVLTIAGYSINDTVVVFDRVRENLRRFKTLPMTDLLNRSVNETLSRTVVTSATTLLALFALFFLGGEVIRDFAFAMIWGVIIGTYSSIWIASTTLLWMGVRPSASDELLDDAEIARTLGD